MNKKTIIIITASLLFAFILSAFGYFYWNSLKKSSRTKDIANSAAQGVIPSLNTNPLENKPNINPADKANPFKNIKTNPFN